MKSVPRTCVLLPLMTQATGHAVESSPRTPQIENDFVAALFDADTGRLNIWHRAAMCCWQGLWHEPSRPRAFAPQASRPMSTPLRRSPCAIAWATDGN